MRAGPLGAHGRCGHRQEGPAPEQAPGLPDSRVSPLLPDTWLALHQASSQHLETGLRKGPAERGQTEVRSQEGRKDASTRVHTLTSLVLSCRHEQENTAAPAGDSIT